MELKTSKVPMELYDNIAKYAKNASHQFIEIAFPKTPLIAGITLIVYDQAHKYSMTYSQGTMADSIQETCAKVVENYLPGSGGIGRFFGHYLVAPNIVPEASPQVSEYFAVGAALATSLTLNLIAQVVFGIKGSSYPGENASMSKHSDEHSLRSQALHDAVNKTQLEKDAENPTNETSKTNDADKGFFEDGSEKIICCKICCFEEGDAL